MVRPSQIRDPRHHDSVSSARARRQATRGTLWGMLAATVVAGLVYTVLWSGLFAVRDITVGALPSAVADAARSAAGGNMLFVNTSALTATLAAQFPELQDIAVAKHYLHAITIAGTPRTAVGVWCRGDECQYWDETGARWGSALPSTGSLLLMVRDERPASASDDAPIAGILAAVRGLPALGLAARAVTLPDAEPGGLRMSTTAGYDLYLDGVGDIADQLNTLGVFLANHAKDPAVMPVYIDLRTPGRVYFK